jgi:anhydro-N-acetylmuramic acid kinase
VSGAYFIGLMSGTSADGIDAVLVQREKETSKLVASFHQPMNPHLRGDILAFRQTGSDELHRLATLDAQLAEEYARATQALLALANVSADQITAIGLHGQTLRHHPGGEIPYTVQIGDANRLAELTRITVVADFRRRDIAAGGQGAPLVPGFHQAQFALPDTSVGIVNIGGIANVTLLMADGSVSGWDTGPGNTLLDGWIAEHRQAAFDEGGQWAAEGTVLDSLLESMLSNVYFSAPPPKSTGPETFHIDWVKAHLHGAESPRDVQRTLLELTVESIAGALEQRGLDAVRVCGGGARNDFLMSRLGERLTPVVVTSTESVGVDPQWVEAWAFAWLAEQTLTGNPGNVPAVTGAADSRILGAIYQA